MGSESPAGLSWGTLGMAREWSGVPFFHPAYGWQPFWQTDFVGCLQSAATGTAQGTATAAGRQVCIQRDLQAYAKTGGGHRLLRPPYSLACGGSPLLSTGSTMGSLISFPAFPKDPATINFISPRPQIMKFIGLRPRIIKCMG